MHQSSNQKENNPMKKLLIILLLISPFSFADWGDVYYCQMTSYLAVSPDGRVEELLEVVTKRFQFKLDETEQAVVFGKKGHFDGQTLPLTPIANLDYSSSSLLETWYAEGFLEMYTFGENTFSYVSLQNHAFIMHADCDKF